ncbi:MAG: Holliday junction branch migration protein RuvA [Candidatus Kerfeldbacteria bacterium CG08_land_8_20_14_0_20_43_14]|uniref:Holliday junction branch migration complex subunit RuvA n=1 Tax=Candidatus Kerfeldbacteria bacterium CG08_land_8_20_14_0_20_43_14 TaxID=2014246 RepID=A0A2H0YQK0_9BACT|nr:MAG: Holliday junction branch migration protein RuvA [Candidatus Kerfeldbacteria bacterium CG08_land_8_20_14_0_20_43_14]
MIAQIRGQITALTVKSAIIDVNGVGYRVFVTPQALAGLEINQTYTLYTHHHQREDAQELYGFLTADERDMFEKLLSVNGVGPKSALGVLSRARVLDIVKAVQKNEISMLTKVSGIGAKTAERIVRELVGKLDGQFVMDSISGTAGGNDDADVISALEQLGYSAAEARTALADLPKEIKDPAAKIKAVLKNHGQAK